MLIDFFIIDVLVPGIITPTPPPKKILLLLLLHYMKLYHFGLFGNDGVSSSLITMEITRCAGWRRAQRQILSFNLGWRFCFVWLIVKVLAIFQSYGLLH